MSSDDLSAPLGQTEPRKRRFQFRSPLSPPQAIAAVLGVVLLGFVGFAIFGNDPMGGEPVARIALKPPAPEEKPPVEVKREPAKAAEKAPEASGQKTITIIDGSSGARRDVVVSSDGAENASEPAGSGALPVMAGSNPKLLEKTRYGMVPIAADGMKPVSAYAAGSDAERARAMKTPSIAIVIGGLGVGAAKTTEAIMKLPAAVTLGFTPYGSDPGKLVERARAQRHEVLLQVPMEPFDYPDNDPGPQTLLATASAEQNLDRLLWHMSRFQGYVGLANFMGARFVAADSAMQPVLRDAAKRGLAYFDDGAAPRSVGQAVAEGTAVPFARADLGIDTSPTSVDIDKALARLESLARERGYAVGTASALPISIERITAWAKTLESRGVMLVPLTTAMLKSKSS